MRAIGALGANGAVAVANFLLAIAIARRSSVEEFGHFSLVVLLYLFVTGAMRASITDTALAARGEASAVRRAVERSALVGVATSIAVLGFGLATENSYALVLAITLPLLCTLDLVRTVEAAVGHSGLALALGVTWTLPSIAVSVLALGVEIPSLVVFAVWAAAGALAGAVSLLWRRLPWVPRWRSMQGEDRSSGIFFLDYLVGSGGSLGTTALLGAFVGPAAVAALRGAGALLGPATLIATTARSLIIPALAPSAGDPLRRAGRIAAAMSAVALPVLVLVALIPDSWGVALLGPTWAVAMPVLMPLALEAYFALISGIPAAGFRAQLAGKQTLMLRLVVGLPRPFAVIGAAVAGGPVAAAWTMAALALFNAVLWWSSYARWVARGR